MKTVKELITELSKYPDDMGVVVRNYNDADFDNVKVIVKSIEHYSNPDGHEFGVHEEGENGVETIVLDPT